MRPRLVSLKTAIVLPIVLLFAVTMAVQFALQQRGLAQLIDGETHQLLRYMSAATRARLDGLLARPHAASASGAGVPVDLSAQLRRQKDQLGGVVVIVDALGRVLAQSESSPDVAGPATGTAALRDSRHPILRAMAPYVVAELADGGASFSLALGEERFYGRVEPYFTSDKLEWRVAVLMPESTMLGDVRKTQVTGLIVATLMAVSGLILTIWVISMVTRPLLQAANAASQSSLSDLSGLRNAATPVRETALLMQAISDMALRLQSSIDRLRDIALVDTHTQLPTRQGLIEMVDWHQPRACALFVVGIDDFRSINNIMGYETGDEVLRCLASRLQALVPAPILIARTGGDEFSLVHELGDAGLGWEALGARLLACFDDVFEINREGLSVSGSVGVMSGDLTHDSLLEWLRSAGFALREAKVHKARECVHYSAELQHDGVRRGRLIADLRQAVERDELRVFYQPIVDLHTGEVEGAEALVRWQHPTRGLLAPGAFIAIAEESELIVRIGEIVLKKVCADSHRHWQATGRWLDLHVNVSSRQLLQFNYQALLMAELQRVGMPACTLTVELTESTFIGHDDDRVSSIFAGLKAVGVLIAVDDFGTGYSSLSYLERLPLDCLKIDRSFVLKLVDPCDRGFAVAAAVIDVGNRLGLKLVAEGVETPVQAQQLQALGCKLAQGYLFAKPTPWDEMVLDLEHAP